MPHIKVLADNSALPIRTKLSRYLQTFIVEPYLFFIVFGFSMRSVVWTQLMLDKACTISLQLSASYCKNITDDSVKISVQRIANNYSMATTLLATIPAIITGIFLGPFSDIYGRKLPLIFAPLGVLIETAGVTLSVIQWDMPMFWYLVFHIPSGIFGGILIMFICVYSYLSETTGVRERPIRFAFLEICVIAGWTLASTIGGAVFKHYGYLPVYCVTLIFVLAGMLWLVVFMKEKNCVDSKLGLRGLVKEMFSLRNIKDSIQTCTKKRDGNIRAQLWLLVMSTCVIMWTFIGSSSIGYLFAKHLYNWDVDHFTYVTTVSTVLHAICVALLMPLFTNIFKLDDFHLGLVGILSIMAQNIARGLAWKEWMYYTGLALGALSGSATVAIQNRITKLVSGNEIGKVLFLVALSESLVPVGSISFYSQVYNISIDFFPGLSYVVGAAILFVPAGILLWLHAYGTPPPPTVPQSESKTGEDDQQSYPSEENIHM